MHKTLFLPGASGSASFWRPAAEHARLEGVFFGWPGLGEEPPHPDINEIDDLVTLVAREITEPVNIIAQSMGGVIALKLALAFPEMVRGLVLAVTSGGVPVADLGGSNWRSNYFAAFPNAAKWIAAPVNDLSSQIPSIKAPALLLWGDADPISPVAVGERLLALLPNARLRVFPGADHDLAKRGHSIGCSQDNAKGEPSKNATNSVRGRSSGESIHDKHFFFVSATVPVSQRHFIHDKSAKIY